MASGQNQLSPASSGKSNDRTTPISTTYYLEQLLWDKYNVDCMPNVFSCVDRLLNEEIRKVKASLLNVREDDFSELETQPSNGPVVSLSEKLFVPYKEYPDFNFVGRILGPRGMTAKQLEQKTGCKIMVRGKGSMRDKHKEEVNRGKPNWEHLNDDLHVLITVEDCKEIAEAKIERAKREISKLLVPSADGEDELKRLQLMELAILNGTYRNDTHEIYSKTKNFDINQVGRRVIPNAIPAGIFFPHMQGQSKLSKELDSSRSSATSPFNMMGFPCQNGYPTCFPPNSEMGGLVYVDPYSPLGGSAYFGSQGYSETSAKAECE